MDGGCEVGTADTWMELRKSLLRYARRLGVSASDAEDAVQCVFVKILSRERTVAPIRRHGSRGNRYMRQMCLNAIRGDRRASGRRRTRETAWCYDPNHASSPEDF